jgi:ribosomal protein S27E
MQFKNRIRCECGSDLIKMTGDVSFHYMFTDNLVTAGMKVQCIGCDREIVDAIGY